MSDNSFSLDVETARIQNKEDEIEWIKKHPGGRPLKYVDFDKLNQLCGMQHTGEECAAIMGIDYDTLNAHIIEAGDESGFSEYYKKHCGSGKASLRRMQWKSAQNGNITMQIFLGKQYLGQVDKQEITGNMSHTLYAQHSTTELQEEADKLRGIVGAGSSDPLSLNSAGVSDKESAE
ncbi:MAG: hypothetical protein Q7J73_06265 [Dehalococcoidales bacterium]|nr:hypothetical protein [Dehalococcoidales bacterium]